MSVLVDTSVLIRFLVNRSPYAAELDGLLSRDEVSGHDFIHSELLIGDKGARRQLLADYDHMYQAPVVPHREVVAFVRDRKLHGRGIGWIGCASAGVGTRGPSETVDGRPGTGGAGEGAGHRLRVGRPSRCPPHIAAGWAASVRIRKPSRPSCNSARPARTQRTRLTCPRTQRTGESPLLCVPRAEARLCASQPPGFCHGLLERPDPAASGMGGPTHDCAPSPRSPLSLRGCSSRAANQE